MAEGYRHAGVSGDRLCYFRAMEWIRRRSRFAVNIITNYSSIKQMSMLAIRTCVIGAICIGCVPVFGEYYKPHGSGVVGAGSTNCDGRIQKDIEFKVAGFPKIYVSAEMPSQANAKTEFAFWFYLPPGMSAKFENAEIAYGLGSNLLTGKLPITQVEISHDVAPNTVQDSGGARIQKQALMQNPDAGPVVSGSGGVRKLRWAAPGRGKRGGYRIIYYVRKAHGVIWMLTMYPKNVSENIPAHVLQRIRKEVEDG